MGRRKARLVVMAFVLAVIATLAFSSVASAAPPSGGYWYQVVPGDTWYGVSRRTGVSYYTLWNANPAHHHWNQWLYVGDWLWIPYPPAPSGYWYQVQQSVHIPAKPIHAHDIMDSHTRELTPEIKEKNYETRYQNDQARHGNSL